MTGPVSIRGRERGYTLVELLIASALAAMLLTAASGLVSRATDAQALAAERERLGADARYAMQRMVRAVGETRQLILPTADNPGTTWPENLREQTIPASPPPSGSTNATAVLAVSLSAAFDIDADGFPDADNDRDGLIDEDASGDLTNDFAPGIYLIDDGGNGQVDEGFFANDDDDERSSSSNEDPINGIDDDGDGLVDEDPPADMNGDGAPGLAGVDDDGDGSIDEGSVSDDDEDGASNEDWIDAHVFFLQGSDLVERRAVPWDETGVGGVTGRDFVASTIAENVSRFRVERPAVPAGRTQLVRLTLELTGDSGEFVSLTAEVRVGGAL